MPLKVEVGCPMFCPTRMDQNRFATDFSSGKCKVVDRTRFRTGNTNDHSIQVRKLWQAEFRHINSITESMEGTIEVCPRVRHHFQPPNLKRRTLGIMRLRRLAAHKVTNYRRRQSFVGYQSIDDRMAQIHKLDGGFRAGCRNI